MEQLDLLWNLEIHHNSLRTYKKELANLENTLMVKDIEEKLSDMKDRLSQFKSNQERIKRKLRESESRLKDYNYKIKEIEDALYNGKTSDLRQLEYLSNEKDKLKNIINNTEMEILEFMEEVESVDNDLLKMEESFVKIKDKNTQIKEQYRKFKEDLINKIQLEEDNMKSLENKIDQELLCKYNKIRKTKVTGIVGVNNSACGGCNMVIPTILIDRLNKNNEIIYCESCGRILCKL